VLGATWPYLSSPVYCLSWAIFTLCFVFCLFCSLNVSVGTDLYLFLTKIAHCSAKEFASPPPMRGALIGQLRHNSPLKNGLCAGQGRAAEFRRL